MPKRRCVALSQNDGGLEEDAGFASDVFYQRLLIVHGKPDASVRSERVHFNRRVGRGRLPGGGSVEYSRKRDSTNPHLILASNPNDKLGLMSPFALLLVAGSLTCLMAQPRYTTDGQLTLPSDYREWAFLSSGLGMSYQHRDRTIRRSSRTSS